MSASRALADGQNLSTVPKKMTDGDGQQMDPNVWGPPLWDALFFVAFCRNEQCEDLKTLFGLLEKVIPCQHCRRSYTMYRREVPPTSTIRADVPNAAAAWLWTIHDMVNQKLGKVCISFDRLVKRHATFTALTSDSVLLDLFCILALAAKPSAQIHVAHFVSVMLRLLPTEAGFRLPDILVLPPHTASPSDTSLLDRLYDAHLKLRDEKGMPPTTREAFDARLEHAYA